MATVAASGASLSAPRSVWVKADYSPKVQILQYGSPCLNHPWRKVVDRFRGVRMYVKPPEKISDMVTESIKNATEVCADNPVSGECIAAWDEVEEVSAAASDARLKKKESDSDTLETHCKDNPEDIECRTYED